MFVASFCREVFVTTEDDWDDRVDHLFAKNLYVRNVRGDGFCFVHSLQASLLANCRTGVSVENLCNMLMTYMLDNSAELSQFHFSEEKMLQECVDFFMNKNYNEDAVDIIVAGAAEALGINLTIYYNSQGVLKYHEINNSMATTRAYLLFTESTSHSLMNHYDAVIPLNMNYTPNPGDPLALGDILEKWLVQKEKDLKYFRELQKEELDVFAVPFDMQRAKMVGCEMVPGDSSVKGTTALVDEVVAAACSLDGIVPDVDEGMDESDDLSIVEESSIFPSPPSPPVEITGVHGLKETALHLPGPSFTQYREKPDELQSQCSVSSATTASSSTDELDDSAPNIHPRLRTALIIAKELSTGRGECVPQIVSNVPEDINGDCCFIIPNCKYSWKEDSSDMRHFVMHTSARQGMEGKRKTGQCKGAFTCQNKDCSFLTTSNGVANHSHFNNFKGMKECRSCGVVASKKPCGLLTKRKVYKIVEYHEELNCAIVWHYGEHTCPPRYNTISQRRILEKKMKDAAKMPGMSIKEFAVQQCMRHFQDGDMLSEYFNASLYPCFGAGACSTCYNKTCLNLQAW